VSRTKDPAAPDQLPGLRVTTRGDAVQELLRIRGFQAVLREYETRVRGWLQGKLQELGEADGTDPACKVKGVGIAYITAPATRWVPTDLTAWPGWARTHHPDAVTQRRKVHTGLVDAWLNSPDGDPAERAAKLRALVGDPRAVDDTVEVRDDLADELAAAATLIDDDLAVDPESGEQLPIRQVATSAATFTFKPAGGAVTALADELRERLGQVLALPPPEPA
jgi:hypothetical protein